MKISELSNQRGVSTRSIRYYVKKRLIQPSRKENGYRVYEEQDIERVKAIQLITLYEEQLLKTRQQIEQLENPQRHFKELIEFWHTIKDRQNRSNEQ